MSKAQRYASLIACGFDRNFIFNLGDVRNRDNGFLSWNLLKENFGRHGIELNTKDVNIEKSVTTSFELHMDVQQNIGRARAYLLMLETKYVCPANGIASNLDCYRKVFTWRDDLVDDDRFIKINFPNPIFIPQVDGWSNRAHFCCLISSNRTLSVWDERILYPERVKSIRWFEKHAPQDFDLYGVDWDIPVMPTGLRGRFMRQVWKGLSRIVKLKPFPSYRGRVGHKCEVLSKTRYAICYENVRDLSGYITEKIFDCFFSGCVPVY